MKRVSEIVANVPVKQSCGDLATFVRELQYDSRKVSREDAFIAIRGFQTDGHRYIQQAYQRGCRVFFVEDVVPDLEDAVVIQLGNTRRNLPRLAKNFYEKAVDRMKIVGVTGTNGKTTTTYLLHSILQAAGWQPGLVNTIETVFGDKRFPNERTTPESLDLYRSFYDMYRKGIHNAVMEVSSHALELHRVDGIPFRAAIFTNLGYDHLEFHKSRENYFLAKAKLFQGLGKHDFAIMNLDDEHGARMVRKTNGDVFTYSLGNPAATVYVQSYQMLSKGMMITFKAPSGKFHLTTSLTGKFNVYNILSAVTAGLALGIHEPQIARGIESLQRVPGRCEWYQLKSGAKVVIDYAHEPEALQRILETMLEFRPRELTVVFGCGGDRDKGKRPKMGKIAENYADKVILTNDNPRSEKPETIAQDILDGIYDQSKVEVILDRRAAVSSALESAGKNDLVLLAGKGHETYQIFADGKVDLDEREVIQEYLS